jgi:hypothetical protein
MKIAYFPEQIALNGKDVLISFLNSLKAYGFTPVENSLEADAAVIWSVLWSGRLTKNREVFEHYRRNNKTVFILEVGTLIRGKTWKVSLNDITSYGIYGNRGPLDNDRPLKLGIKLANPNLNRNPSILIAGQHFKSQQWKGLPNPDQWVKNTIASIRQYTDRPIVLRPHPRAPLYFNVKDITVTTPKKIPNSHEEYNISFNHHCVINHNSGPGVLSVINGTPVICDKTSLAWPMSTTFENIETAHVPDRENWFIDLCHTEWTVEEIGNGVPLSRLIPHIDR